MLLSAAASAAVSNSLGKIFAVPGSEDILVLCNCASTRTATTCQAESSVKAGVCRYAGQSNAKLHTATADSKCMGDELQQSREVAGEVGPVVAAGVEVKFVGNVARGEQFIEGRGTDIEAVIVFRAAIEINFQAG